MNTRLGHVFYKPQPRTFVLRQQQDVTPVTMHCKLLRARLLQLTSPTHPHPSRPLSRRHLSSTNTTAPESDPPPHDPLPTKPTWSLRSLTSPSHTSPSSTTTITPQTLNHLLRLSALPLPTSTAEQEKMLQDLHSQLAFVRAVQDVDIPEGIEPLQCVRDETEEGRREAEFGLEALGEELGKERVVGKRGRIVRRENGDGKDKAGDKDGMVKDMAERSGGKAEEKVDEEKGWDLLKLAPRTRGRFVVVDTMED
ncbi:MAG: hypothetical protein Q9184_005348 [Pyrenodesmia sp. 2 TL-2023]